MSQPPIDFANYQELMMANAQMKKNGQPQLYQMAPLTNMVPGIFPIPIISMRANDFDYRGWVAADGTYVDGAAYATARPAYEGAVVPPQLAIPAVKQGGSRPSSPPVELCSSPRFGPGPPIVTSERVKGPRGCNLFVFHLPNEITNWDLYLLFRRFGTILSVHTMVNKATGLSKGFGFVSYSAPQEATAAITEMDGFRLGKKRLKVQLKRSQDDNPDEELEGEYDDNSATYPANAYEDQSAAGGPSNGGHAPGARGFESRSRQSSFNSAYSCENGGSGTTTRASTPYGQSHHHHPTHFQQPSQQHHRNEVADEEASGGYYHGVDSTPHSPTALEETNKAADKISKLTLNSNSTRETRSNQSSLSASRTGSSSGNNSSGSASSGVSQNSGRVPRV